MPKKILLADDSVTIQKVVELTFAEGDYEVFSVSNGRAAIDKIKEMRPDILLCDIIMPEVSGYEVASFVKKDPAYKGIPVILLTGTFEPFDKEQAQQSGADAFITKPFDSRMLVEKVETLLNERLVLDPTQAPKTAQVFQSRQEFTVGTPDADQPPEEPEVREETESAAQAFEELPKETGAPEDVSFESSPRTFEGEPVQDEAESAVPAPEGEETSFADITPEEGVEPAPESGPDESFREAAAFDETAQPEIIDENLLRVDEGVPEGSFEGVLEPEEAMHSQEEPEREAVPEPTAGEPGEQAGQDTGSSYAMTWSEPAQEEGPEKNREPAAGEWDAPSIPPSGAPAEEQPAEPAFDSQGEEAEVSFGEQGASAEVPDEEAKEPAESLSGMEDWGGAQSFEDTGDEPRKDDWGGAASFEDTGSEPEKVEYGLPDETGGSDEDVEPVEGLVHGMTDQQQMISDAQAAQGPAGENEGGEEEQAFAEPGRPEEPLPEFTPEAAHEGADRLPEAEPASGEGEEDFETPYSGVSAEERQEEADVPAPEAAGEASAPQEEEALAEEPSREVPSPLPAAGITPEQLEEAIRKALGDKVEEVLRQVAWEVIPELAESIIKRRIQELESDAE